MDADTLLFLNEQPSALGLYEALEDWLLAWTRLAYDFSERKR